MSEQEPLLGPANDVDYGSDGFLSTNHHRMQGWRQSARRVLEKKAIHRAIVALVRACLGR